MYEGQDAVQEAEKISKINSAGLINLRINNLWVDANKHSRAGLYEKWNSDLDCIWDELSGDVPEKKSKNEEEKTIYEKYFELNEGVSEKLSKLPNNSDPFADYTKKQKQKLVEVYVTLRKKSEFLRRLQNTQGKGTAYKEEEDQWE